MPIVAGSAFHEYPDVPTSAASHGCVRVPQYWSQLLYRFAPIDTPVRVLTRSL
jgi:lipoprotein-anchoring transpeptidase ErfK/SrfK